MIRKKLICAVLVAVCLLGAAVGATALEVDCDNPFSFSAAHFSQESLEGVCITGLPDPSVGTVKLGQRVIRCGDILTAEQLDTLCFHPLRTQEDVDAVVTYLPIYENRVEKAATVTVSVRAKRDKPPVAEDSSLETYKNLPNTGTLKAYDPEGEVLTYTLIRAPKRGDVTIDENGTFVYTPRKNRIGTDSFTYTATDPAGNVSRQATVTIEILKPNDRQTYADTLYSDCRFSAEWMRNAGIFTGEMIGNRLCFRPEAELTRGEFLTMLVELLNVPVDADAAYTGFTDECPSWLRPYLAAALRAGLTAGWSGGSVFGADESISAQEAALLLQNALAFPLSTGADGESADLLTVMAENGILLSRDGGVTRGEAANALYRVSRLSATAPGMLTFAKLS